MKATKHYYADENINAIERRIENLAKKEFLENGGVNSRGQEVTFEEFLEEKVHMEINKDIKRDIGNRLRKFRKEKNFTQEKMIAKYRNFLPSDPSKYSLWENGFTEISLRFVVYLHEVEGVNLNELLCGDKDTENL